MDQGLQARILARCHTRIRATLDIDAIFPHLNGQALLTDNEINILRNNLHTVQYRIDCLVQWLPRKGRDALSRFIVCLRMSSGDALGHEELADLLDQEVRSATVPSYSGKSPLNRYVRGCKHRRVACKHSKQMGGVSKGALGSK